jgi:hypothetical protein
VRFLNLQASEDPLQTTVDADDVYLLQLVLDTKIDFNANVSIQMRGTYGYLSAADWPLLPVSSLFINFKLFYSLVHS